MFVRTKMRACTNFFFSVSLDGYCPCHRQFLIMPKGKYKRSKTLGRKRKRSNAWRQRSVATAIATNDLPPPDEERKVIRVPENPPPATRIRRDCRIHRAAQHVIADSNLSERERRLQIFWYWRDTLNSPPPSQWTGHNGIISVIIEQLRMSAGSRDVVKRVLKNAWKLFKKGLSYDGSSGRVGQPSNRELQIKPGSLDEQIVADCREDNFSYARIAHMVYKARLKTDPAAKPPGASAIRNACLRLNPTVTGIYLDYFVYMNSY